MAAVVTILSGCAQPGPAAPSGASTSESAADSARTHGSSSGPTKDGGQSRTSSPTSSAKVSERSAGKSSAAKPTLEPRPEADLSDKQIPKIYSDDIAPGQQVTATLCNLTRGHLEVLEKHIAGHNGVDDSNLRLALISLGDLLDVWEGLTWDFPTAADDIDTARDVYASWDLALALRESGDPAGAQEQLDAASAAIDRLPADPEVERGCGT
ncbi:hypothetical protein [Janibacter corallicola]|uniref:hypothetical protein n=1 Tax=Janibacter corallicola TaxID=415212 RepID=UPI000830A29E|nr:hypothetical protein [Janibacter corallicola]